MNNNKQFWDSVVQAHLSSDFYDVKAFLNGSSSLNPIELHLLGDVSGKDVLHLQCHFGLDSLSLARQGAKVSALDFSDEAIAAAKQLATVGVMIAITPFRGIGAVHRLHPPGPMSVTF